MSEFFTPTVIWFLIGIVLFLLEIVIPGLILLFFGIGACLVSISLLIYPDLSLNFQLIIFILGSLLSLLLLRKYLKNKFFNEEKSGVSELDDEFIGKSFIVDVALKAGVPGKVNFKGTTWTAVSDIDISAGGFAVIKDKESITLKVTKK